MGRFFAAHWHASVSLRWAVSFWVIKASFAAPSARVLEQRSSRGGGVCDPEDRYDGRALLAVSQTLRYMYQGGAMLSRPPVDPGNASLALVGEEEEKPRKARKQKKKKQKKKKYTDKDNNEEKDEYLKMRKGQRVTSDAHVIKGLGLSPELFVSALFSAVFASSLGFCCWVQSDVKRGDVVGNGEEPVQDTRPVTIDFDEDTYGLAMGIFIKDTTAIATGEGRQSLRSSRLVATVLLLCMNFSLQVYLTIQVKRFVTPRAVEEVRDAYSEFEWVMHGQNMSHMKWGPHGTIVGDPEYFDVSMFAGLDIDLKDKVCHIPLAQPIFFVCILFIWTLTCVGDLKRSLHWLEKLILVMKTADSMGDVMTTGDDFATSERKERRRLTTASSADQDSQNPSPRAGGLEFPQSLAARSLSAARQGPPTQVIRLTSRMKAYIGIAIILPRILIVLDLLMIGCRWLAATVNFGDLIMNAVALEFMLLLKDLLFVVLVPHRTKKDLRSLDVTNYNPEGASFRTFMGGFLWGFAALVWANYYCFYWQEVLPDYNWDVRSTCAVWLEDVQSLMNS